MPKVSKKQALIAGAVAGISLLGTIAGYSIYLVRHHQKKVDFKKMKIEVLKQAKMAQKKAIPMVKNAAKSMKKSMAR